MKKSKYNRNVQSLQNKADKSGTRLRYALGTEDMTDAAVVERLLKKGLKDREPVM